MNVNNNIMTKEDILNKKKEIINKIIKKDSLEIPQKPKINKKYNYDYNFPQTTKNNFNHFSSMNNLNNQNYKKFNNNGIQTSRNVINKLLYIPCMNCGNEIPVNEVEKHSSICLTVNNDILKKENDEEKFELINYKLKKIGDHLNNIFLGKLDQVTDILRKEVSIYGRELYKYISNSINIEDATINNIKFLKILCENCENIQKKYGKLSLSSSIIIDRVKVLINEKIFKIKTILRKRALIRRNLNQKKYETNISLFKNNNIDSETENNNYNNNYNIKNKIEEIQSDIENQTINQLNNTITSLNSSVSSQSFYNTKTDLKKK